MPGPGPDPKAMILELGKKAPAEGEDSVSMPTDFESAMEDFHDAMMDEKWSARRACRAFEMLMKVCPDDDGDEGKDGE